jgi:hypothetical protein
MPDKPDVPSLPADRRAVITAYLREVRSTPRGRLLFALDATASRQPTWDTACQLQADMFHEAAVIGGLDVSLIYYRGLKECMISPWVSQPEKLAALMEKIHCCAGETQIGKVIACTRRETQNLKVQALVFVGDAMEENPDDLCRAARNLGVPTFIFQEGDDPVAEQVFREITNLTGGAYCRFDPDAASQLRELLRAAAAFAAGGVKALAAVQGAGAARLLLQLRCPPKERSDKQN